MDKLVSHLGVCVALLTSSKRRRMGGGGADLPGTGIWLIFFVFLMKIK